MNKVDQIKKDLNLVFDYSELDFSKQITREHIDWEVYHNKIKFAKKVKEMQNPNPLYLKVINEDKTMRAYYFLRLNNKPVELYAYQDLFINDPYRYKYFEAANQIGKSMTLDIDAVLDFTEDHDGEFNDAIISITLPQSTHQMRRIKQLLNSMSIIDWREDKGTSDNMSIVELDWKDDKRTDSSGNPLVKYVNRVICVPATDAALGYDLHKARLDEFEFWDNMEYMHDQVLEPRTYGTKGDMFITTNPNGNDNKGAELTKLKLPNGTNKYHVYNFNFLDRPGNTEEELEAAKAGKTRQIIESTLLSIRSLSDRNYFTSEEIERSEDPKMRVLDMVGKHPFAFLDIGAKHDQSVLGMGFVELGEGYDDDKDVESNLPHIHLHLPIIHVYPVGYPLSRVVGSVDSKQEGDGWHYEKSVKEHLAEWTIDGATPTFGYDITGNQGMKPLFDSINILGAIDVTFSGPVKSGMYQRFKFMMEKGLIHRIKHREWDSQARTVEVKKGARGYLLINSDSSGTASASKKKKIPDDCMDMTAGLIHLMDNPNRVSANFELI